MNKSLGIFILCSIVTATSIVQLSAVEQNFKWPVNYLNTANADNQHYFKDSEVSEGRTMSRNFFPRKQKHSLLLLMGGLQSLITFVILKIKVVLFIITAVGVTIVALKLFGIFKYSNYIYKSNYPIVSGPFDYGYPVAQEYPQHEEFNDWSGNLHSLKNSKISRHKRRRKREI